MNFICKKRKKVRKIEVKKIRKEKRRRKEERGREKKGKKDFVFGSILNFAFDSKKEKGEKEKILDLITYCILLLNQKKIKQEKGRKEEKWK